VASPGPLDPRQGIVLEAPNLSGWRDVPLAPRLSEALGTRVFLGNDANCAALGEFTYGAGREVRYLVYVTISTGIGGGVIDGGRLLEGATGAAGEVGHMTIDLAGPRCNCGNVGCWEALASGTGITAQARAALARGEPSSLAGHEHVSADLVTAAAHAGDPLARAIIDRAARATGFGLVNLAHLYDPELIVLGGGVLQAGDLILGPARQIFDTYAMPNYRRTCRITTAALGDDVGLYGAGALVHLRLADDSLSA
jgi:glucokinase